ncbi:hypothetical protein FRC17_009784 [Serendipita sp. 399]|nr:hypothetical protein FRC17_009784 [Serendipita sp. 399]
MAYQHYGPPGGPPPGHGGYGGGGGYGGYNAGGFAQNRGNPGPPPATELQQALVNGDWSPFDLDTVKLLMALFDADRSGTIGMKSGDRPPQSNIWTRIPGILRPLAIYQRMVQATPLFRLLILFTILIRQNVFRHFDRDRSGSIEGEELKAALSQFGYNLNPQLLQLLERKYVMDAPNKASAPPTTHGGYGQPPPRPGITFGRFVRCCVVVRQLTESFNRLDTQRNGWVTMNYDTFMHTVLSAP